MENIKLSIIVPVYNTERYIQKCMDSIMSQNAPGKFEIIIIDDGSTDNSISIICSKYNKENLHIVQKPNGGLSSARNKGLSIAKGEYVWFIDSDDWIESNILNEIFFLCSNSVDIVAQTEFIPEGNWKGLKVNKTDRKVKTGIELCATSHLTAAQFYIFRREFLISENLFFFEGIFHEDVEFIPRALYKSKSIIFYDKPIYHYLKRENSITSKVNPKRCHDYMLIINKLTSFMIEQVEVNDRRQFGNIITNCVLELFYLSMFVDDSTKKKIKLYLQANKTILYEMKYSYRIFTRVLGYIAYVCQSNVLHVYAYLFQIRKILYKLSLLSNKSKLTIL